MFVLFHLILMILNFIVRTLLAHANNNNLSVIMMTKGGFGTLNPFCMGAKLEKIREREAIERYGLIYRWSRKNELCLSFFFIC